MNSLQYNEALVRMSLKECKDLLKTLRSDFASGIYVKSKELHLIEKIIILEVHIKRMMSKRPKRTFLQFLKHLSNKF